MYESAPRPTLPTVPTRAGSASVRAHALRVLDRRETAKVVDTLLRDGRAINPAGHQVRMMAFGSISPAGPHPTYQVVLLRDILRFLRRHLQAHWSVLHQADFKDPAFSFLMMLEKAGDSSAGVTTR